MGIVCHVPIAQRRLTLWTAGVVISILGFQSGKVGDVGTTTIEARFTENVNATDYKAGVTIKVNAIGVGINSATRQSDHRIVHYVIASAVDIDDGVTWEYDDDFGDYEDDEGNPMGDIGATACTNYVGSHLYWDTADDSAWVGVLG